MGLIAKGSVILATDMRASMGHLAYDEESRKLYKITDKMGVTNAGSVGDSLTIIRHMQSHARLYEIERETKITPEAMATYLSNILNANRYYPFQVQFILGGINNRPEIYELTAFGGVLKRKRYAVSGSGTELALSTLDNMYKTTMTEDEGIILAIRAITAGKKRDIYSGGKSVAVMIVSDKGVTELTDAEVSKIIAKEKIGVAE